MPRPLFELDLKLGIGSGRHRDPSKDATSANGTGCCPRKRNGSVPSGPPERSADADEVGVETCRAAFRGTNDEQVRMSK